jgi:hypothetical protein
VPFRRKLFRKAGCCCWTVTYNAACCGISASFWFWCCMLPRSLGPYFKGCCGMSAATAYAVTLAVLLIVAIVLIVTGVEYL